MEGGAEARLSAHRGSTWESGSGTACSHESLWKSRTQGERRRGHWERRLSPSDRPNLPETEGRTRRRSPAAGTRAPAAAGRVPPQGRRRRRRCGSRQRSLGSSCRSATGSRQRLPTRRTAASPPACWRTRPERRTAAWTSRGQTGRDAACHSSWAACGSLGGRGGGEGREREGEREGSLFITAAEEDESKRRSEPHLEPGRRRKGGRSLPADTNNDPEHQEPGLRGRSLAQLLP